LLHAFGGIAACTAAGRATSAAAAMVEASTLAFYHVHTAERLQVTYRERGVLVPGALQEVEHFLRDFRTEQTHAIDVGLLDQLNALFEQFDRRGNFEVISGYRSPHTNAALRAGTTGVAERSLHISGRAIDIRLTSAKTAALKAAAVALRRGGVGYYPESNFVHLDTGAFRTW
jgi:uncharacterized protein YcbK (DUF882 family)